MGAAFGTAKAGIGIAGIGSYRPDLIMKVRLRNSAQVRVLMHTVPDSHRHVWYPRGLLARHLRAHC